MSPGYADHTIAHILTASFDIAMGRLKKTGRTLMFLLTSLECLLRRTSGWRYAAAGFKLLLCRRG
jgi:hydrogenase/urease accessory protein HupE